jgi:hypothetical protein
MVNVGTGGIGTKIINSKYPVVSGLEAGTTKQEGRSSALEVKELSLITCDERVGVD